LESIVDTSVWVSFLNGKDTSLDKLLPENKVVTNDVVLMELLPFIQFHRNKNAVQLLESIKNVPMKIDWRNLREIRMKNLQNGINNVTIPDLMILQQALQNNLPICSFDKHFRLMQKIFEFELIEG